MPKYRLKLTLDIDETHAYSSTCSNWCVLPPPRTLPPACFELFGDAPWSVGDRAQFQILIEWSSDPDLPIPAGVLGTLRWSCGVYAFFSSFVRC